MSASAKIETKTVRVTRTSTVERVESVELEITRRSGDYKSHGRLAVDLILATAAAGQPIDWKIVSEDIKTYPAPEIEADDAPVAAPPVDAEPVKEVA